MSQQEAVIWLPVRPGACVSEVQRAFHARLFEIRPDLPGRADGSVTGALKQARETLLAVAGPDRRHHRRGGTPDKDVMHLRRSTWGMGPARDSSVDLTL